MDGISVMLGLVVGAIAGGCIMKEQGYMRGKLDEVDKQDRVDRLFNEMQGIKESIEELKIEQECINIIINDLKNR